MVLACIKAVACLQGWTEDTDLPRSCPRCSEINLGRRAATCRFCPRQRQALGAVQEVLTLWCLSCATAEERGSGLCHGCFGKRSQFSCHHCGQSHEGMDATMRCATASCTQSLQLCPLCLPMTYGRSGSQCKSCWRKDGRWCIFCNKAKGEERIPYLRTCEGCASSPLCLPCASPFANHADLPRSAARKG